VPNKALLSTFCLLRLTPHPLRLSASQDITFLVYRNLFLLELQLSHWKTKKVKRGKNLNPSLELIQLFTWQEANVAVSKV
jgi:hypothetical protein